MALEIDKKVHNDVKSEISSMRIGDLVMEELRKQDEVAYVRFASVYREFKDLSSFMEELKKLVKEK